MKTLIIFCFSFSCLVSLTAFYGVSRESQIFTAKDAYKECLKFAATDTECEACDQLINHK